MSADSSETNTATITKKTIAIDARDLYDGPSWLRRIGGSLNEDWNNRLLNETAATAPLAQDDEERISRSRAIISGLIGINPKGELEGMIAAQMLAGHFAAMECYRRAMLPNQTIEGRRENLTQANKLSRTYTMLLDSLNRHRGKGQQKVTVEHVHVHKGGQAIVGNVETPGGGFPSKVEIQPHAKQITNASQPALRSPNPERESLPIPVNAKRALSDARRPVPRRSKGK
jgi:hypothetical protein